MKRLMQFVWPHKKAVILSVGLVLVGAFFRWEVKEVVDSQAGKVIAHRRGVAFPWQACGPGMQYGSTRINFHVRHWVCYGLIRVEATGQTYAKVDNT